jgi:hypothetical protein
MCAPSWTSFLGGFVSEPALANGVVYAGTHNALKMFDSSTRAQLFSITTGSTTLSPAIANGAVYASTVDFNAGGGVSAYALSSADTTPPVITVPGTITTDATSPNGAVVTYSVSGPIPTMRSPRSLARPPRAPRSLSGRRRSTALRPIRTVTHPPRVSLSTSKERRSNLLTTRRAVIPATVSGRSRSSRRGTGRDCSSSWRRCQPRGGLRPRHSCMAPVRRA